MSTLHAAALLFLGLVALERVAELFLSRRHVRRLLARGGVEVGHEHYPVMVALHAALLVSAAAEGLDASPPLTPLLTGPALGLAVGAQALRMWAISTLGDRWTTRVVVLPHAPLVKEGPYRFLRHPNYLAVVSEVAALPLAVSAWRTAIGFSLANAALLLLRLRVEERALAGAAGSSREVEGGRDAGRVELQGEESAGSASRAPARPPERMAVTPGEEAGT